MEQLIKVTEKEGKQLVSARELYAFLGIGTDFMTWCKRMFDYGFVENEDYTPLKSGEHDNQIVTNYNPKMDYALYIDCAKEIAMVQRSEKGKRARLHFIECEKLLLEVAKKSLPISYAQALRELADREEEKEHLERELRLAQPKIDFFNQVAESKDAIDLGSAAKILNLGIGRNRLFEFLRDKKVLMSNNQPYQSYSDKGWFRVIEQSYIKPTGETCINIKTLVYQKGLDAILRLINSSSKNFALSVN